MNFECIKVFNHTKWHQKAGLKSLGDLAVWNVGILDGELEAQMLIESVVIQVREVPKLVERLEVFEGDDHATCPMVMRAGSPRGIDEDPKVEIPEDIGFFSSRHARDFTLASDMIYSIRPWSGNLDENVVLEDLLGFSMDLTASPEDGQLILIVGGLFGIVGLDF